MSRENTYEANMGTFHSQTSFEQIDVKGNLVYKFFKRFFDIILSLLALILSFPLMLVISAIIYIDSPGASPIYKQKRIGKNGKEFCFYKLRTMVADADDMLEALLKQNEMEGPAFKIKDDPRITRIGRFLRRTSIDEVPQFWNVLKGDMSIVGPRPPLPREVEQYSEYQMQRLLVKPGLTCYWQVSHNRNDMSFDEWLALDFKYMRERNLWVDTKLLFKTVCAVFGQEGV